MGPKLSRKIVLLLTGVLLIAALAGCSTGQAAFQEAEHAGTELYAESFATHALTVPQFTLRIHDEIYDAESGQALYDAILADVAVLSELLAADRPLEITLIPETPDGEVLSAGESFYCTPEDVLEGHYHAALVRAYTGFDQPWKLIGVEGLAFGDPVDQADLVDYYSDEDNLNTLSLFPAYFIDAYNSRTDLAIAQDTAVSLTNYILVNDGAEALYQPVGQSDYRQAWLDSLEISTTYQPAYDLIFLDEAQFTSSEKYPLIITTPNRVYAFTGNFVDSPLPIVQLLAYYPSGMDKLLNVLQEEAPTHYARVQSTWEEPLNVYFDGNLAGTYSEPAKRNLYFPGPGLKNLFYQTILFLLPPAEGKTQIWKTFGLTDYLYSTADVPDAEYYSFFQVSPDELTGDNAKYLSEIQAYYLARAPYPAELEDFDFGLLYDAMAMITLSNPTLEITYPRIAGYPSAAWSREENKYLAYSGNSLTVPEAYLFTKYLVETYGLDAMLNYYGISTTAAFKDTFGLSYSEAFANFRTAYEFEP